MQDRVRGHAHTVVRVCHSLQPHAGQIRGVLGKGIIKERRGLPRSRVRADNEIQQPNVFAK